MQRTPDQLFTYTKGLPLTKTTRNELVQYFHFGSTQYTTPQGLVLDIGEITLAVNCPWQLQLADGSSIKDSDVYIRKREAGLPNPVWDWKTPGSSFRDQRLTELTRRIPALVVEHMEWQAHHGFILHFTDRSTLTVSPDPAEALEEYWQLFSNTGNGLKLGAGKSGLEQ